MLNNFPGFLSANRFYRQQYTPFMLLFFLLNACLLLVTYRHPIGDFGNYYYGSKLFAEGIDPLRFYTDIHFFNSAIRPYEPGPFLENYTPVPPFSLLFYLPFLPFACSWAKLFFNLLGLLLLCASLFRTMRFLQLFNYWFYALPFVFLQPLYSNYYQGQSYVLITALLLEFFIAWRQDKKALQGLLIALLFSLKIFPAVVLIIPLFTKNRMAVVYTVLFLALLQLITLLAVGKAGFIYYYTQVLPRLSYNHITEPFSFTNQSVHTFLLNAFVYEPFRNPAPVLASTTLAFIMELLFYGLVFGLLVAVIKTAKPVMLFFMALLMLVLINRYSTVYGLLILLPFVFMPGQLPQGRFVFVVLMLLAACNIPVHRLANLPFIFQYLRPCLFLILFAVLVLPFRQHYRLRYFSVGLLFIVPCLQVYNYRSELKPILLSTAGILYDFRVGQNKLELYNCLGNRDTVEAIGFKVQHVDSTSLHTDGSIIFKDGQAIYMSAGGQVKKPILLDSTRLLFMTDENRGIGMYVLAEYRLKNEQ